MKTDSGLSAYCHGNADLQMYGSDAGQPPPSLYTKGLKPLCDTYAKMVQGSHTYWQKVPRFPFTLLVEGAQDSQ